MANMPAHSSPHGMTSCEIQKMPDLQQLWTEEKASKSARCTTQSILSLPEGPQLAAIPAESKLAMFRTCKYFRALLLNYHNGLVIQVPVVVDNPHDMGMPYVKRFLQSIISAKSALKHASRDSVTLWLSGHGLTSPYPELDIVLFGKSFVQRGMRATLARFTSLRRLRITGFTVSDLFPVKLLALLPNLTHLEVDDMVIRINQGGSNHGNVVMPNLSACKLQHVSIGKYRLFGHTTYEIWSSLTISHILPNVTSLTAVDLHASFTRFINPANIRRLKLTGKPGECCFNDLPRTANVTLARQLAPYTQLEHITIPNLISPDVMLLLLGMKKLQEAELKISVDSLVDDYSDYSEHVWPLKRLTLSIDVIKPKTLWLLRRLPLHSIKKVQIKHFLAVWLPDRFAHQFKTLASRIDWVRQTHQVDVSFGTAAAAAIVPCLVNINIGNKCKLDKQFLLALARAADVRRLTINMLWYSPTSQEASISPVICQHAARYVLGSKPIILNNDLPRIHNLTAITIIEELLDIVFLLQTPTNTANKQRANARNQLHKALISCNNDNSLRHSMDELQHVCRKWLQSGGTAMDVARVLHKKFGVLSLEVY